MADEKKSGPALGGALGLGFTISAKDLRAGSLDQATGGQLARMRNAQFAEVPEETRAEVRRLLGITQEENDVARALGIGRYAVMRVAAGMRVTKPTAKLVEINLAAAAAQVGKEGA